MASGFVERVVRHAVFAYVDPDGVNRMAVRGDTVRVDGAELERGERFEVFFDDEDVADVGSPLDGALVGDDEVLDGIIDEVDLVEAVANLDEDHRAALAAALEAAAASLAASPAGAQQTPLDVDATAAAASGGGDELGSTGVVGGSAEVNPVTDAGVDGSEQLEPPRLAATKDAWIDFRVAESGGRLTKEQLSADGVATKAQLQDDAFVAALPAAQA